MDRARYLLNQPDKCNFFLMRLDVFCQAQPRPWLVFAVAVPYLITVVAMGLNPTGCSDWYCHARHCCIGSGKCMALFTLDCLGSVVS